MIYDYFRVTGAHDTVLDYCDLFSVTLRDDNIQEFDTRWDEVLLLMTKIPSDDVLESLCKLRIREFAQLKTVLELYDMEIHQKIPRVSANCLWVPGGDFANFSLVLAILRLSSTRELSFELFYGVREIQKNKKHRNHGYEKRGR